MDTFFADIGAYLESLFFYRLPFFPKNIRISLFVILFCVIGVIEIYLFVFYKKLEDLRNKRIDKVWKDLISDMLTTLIIHSEEDKGVKSVVSNYISRFKKLPLQRKRVRTILVDEIKLYESNFLGFTAEVLRELFVALNLESYSVKKLKSRYWEVQVEGVREIAQFWLVKYEKEIFKLTDHEHEIVRMEAQSAYVKINKDAPFKFLDTLNRRLLPWQQLVLFEIITKAQNVKIPSFGKWLDSLNDTVVIFCLKLISHFQQLDALDKIVSLLNHPNEEVRIQAVHVIGKLETEFVENKLYDVFFTDNHKVRLEVLKSIGRISSGNYLDFLKNCLSELDFEIRMTAMKSILAHGKKGVKILEDLKEKQDSQNLAIITHVLDRRI